MRTQRGTSSGQRVVTTGPAARAVLVVALAVGSLAACGDDVPAPTADPATAEELQALQEDVAALGERIDALEEQAGEDAGADGGPATDGGEQPGEDGAAGGEVAEQPYDDPAGVFSDPESLIGQDVTVTAEVSSLVAVTQVGAVFRLAGGSGNTVGVVMVTPPADLEVGDVLRVTGPVARVEQDGFESDFGISADALVEDPEAFFSDVEGEIAIAAREIEQVPQLPG